MLERLVEDLGGVPLPPQLAGDRGHRGLEDLGEPAVHGHGLGDGPTAGTVELGAVAREVVEQAARLVLLRRQARQRVQPPPVVAGLDDARVQPQPVAVLAGDELELVDVEAELVQPVEPLVDPVARVVAERLLARQLVPERLVARDELGRRLLRRELALAVELRLDVGELARDVLLRDQQVVPPLAVREARVQLAGLGVDEVRGQRAGVAAEERVRERAVAPEEAAQVEADEQLGAARRAGAAAGRGRCRARRASGTGASSRGAA